MNTESIEKILRMRMAVYGAGVNAGLWSDLDELGASAMMNYIFPKSGSIAFYNLILEQMRKEHSMFMGGTYSLFKMPVQVEKEIMEYLKGMPADNDLKEPNPEDYLAKMNTITTDLSLVSVNIGRFSIGELDNILRLCAAHYTNAFQTKTRSFPFFE